MTRFEKVAVWGSTAVVSVSGFGYAGFKYLMTPSDPFAIVSHPLQPVMLKLHVLSAPVFMFAVGLIALRHIWPHLVTGVRRGRRSGITAALVLGPMVVSGYLIQVITGVGWLRALVIVHLATGTLFAVGAALHAVATRRRRGARVAENSSSDASSAELPAPRAWSRSRVAARAPVEPLRRRA